MADKTGIEWTDATWNPVTGCTRVSEGCDHCYIARTPPFRMKGRQFDGDGPGSTTGVLLHPERLGQPLRWQRPRRVFVNSLSDLFHEDVPDGYIAQVWEVMAHAPQHTFQILTKRPGRMRSWLKRWHDTTGDELVDGAPMPRGPAAVRDVYTSPRAGLFADKLDSMGTPPEGFAYPLYDWMEGPRWFPGVLPNVWLGVSVESQKWVDVRIPVLLDTPAAVRFLSCEPLLGPVDIINGIGDSWMTGLDWVIAGGESGPGARPMHPDWARSLRDQCDVAGVAFHFKQWGEWAPVPVGAHDDKAIVLWPDGVRVEGYTPGLYADGFAPMFRKGKRHAGRNLDGRTHDDFPKVVSP